MSSGPLSSYTGLANILFNYSHSCIANFLLQFYKFQFKLRWVILTPSIFSFSKLLLFDFFYLGPTYLGWHFGSYTFLSLERNISIFVFYGSYYSIFSIFIGTGVLLNPTGTFNNWYGKIIGEFLFQKLVSPKLPSIIIRLWLSYYLHR